MMRRENSTEDHEEDFADLLGRYRLRAGLKQQELANKIAVHRNTIVNWENRTSWPESRGQVLQLADAFSLSKGERKAFIQAARFSTERWPREIWTIPQQRDMFFTGRDDMFQSLRQLLVPGSVTALTQAISGLGGIGKTHTAIEYAYRFHQYYEAVLWLQANSWEVLVLDCIKLADELGLLEQKETNKVVAKVRPWLQKHRFWLLILDNVEHPQEILPKFVPTAHQGCILVTTRIHTIEPLAQTQVLETMSEKEGVLFLLRRTKKVASRAGLDQASGAQHDEAREIWQLMEGQPLALDQAGAYILETGCSFSDYREQYTRRRAELLNRRGKKFIGHETSAAATFSLAFERVEVLNPMAADILRACSLLYNEAIPEELFQEGAEHLGPHLATDRDSWDLTLGILQDYSLVQRNTDEKTLTVHRLVQAVMQDTLSEQESEMWKTQVIAAMNAVFPQVEHSTWSQCARLMPRALLCVNRTTSWEQTNQDLASLLFKTARYLHDRGQYPEAEPLYQRALHIREQALGPDHASVGSTLNGLANIYREQGKYAEAEPLYQRAIAILERSLGPQHSEMGSVVYDFAAFQHSQGNREEAKPWYQRALTIYEQALGQYHPATMETRKSYATLLREMGRQDEAALLEAIQPEQVKTDGE